MSTESKEYLLAKWADGSISEEDLAKLKEQFDLGQMEKILAHSSRAALPAFSEEDAWLKFLELRKNQQKVKRMVLPWWVSSAAAAIAIMIIAMIAFPKPPQVLKTGIGETQTVALPDGSSVVLNAQSVLKFREHNFDKKRKVSLEGEGYFDVEPGSSFKINSPGGKVEVLGTTFNIRSRASFFDVTCYSGKVRIVKKQTGHLLEPGQKLTAKPSDPIRIEPTEAVSHPQWMDGFSAFQNIPLREVAEEFRRQYGRKLILEEELHEKPYTGIFPNTDLDQALKFICDPMNLIHITIDSTTIEIKPRQ